MNLSVDRLGIEKQFFSSSVVHNTDILSIFYECTYILSVHLGPGLNEELDQVVVALPGRQVEGIVLTPTLGALQLLLA